MEEEKKKQEKREERILSNTPIPKKQKSSSEALEKNQKYQLELLALFTRVDKLLRRNKALQRQVSIFLSSRGFILFSLCLVF